MKLTKNVEIKVKILSKNQYYFTLTKDKITQLLQEQESISRSIRNNDQINQDELFAKKFIFTMNSLTHFLNDSFSIASRLIKVS